MLSETAVAVSGSGASLSCASASRAEALRNLAQAGEQAKAAQVFAEAERVAQAIPYDSSRARVLNGLAQALAQQIGQAVRANQSGIAQIRPGCVRQEAPANR
jgi:hypothetical protein